MCGCLWVWVYVGGVLVGDYCVHIYVRTYAHTYTLYMTFVLASCHS